MMHGAERTKLSGVPYAHYNCQPTHPSCCRIFRGIAEPSSYDDVLAEDVGETFIAGRADVVELGDETMLDPVNYHLRKDDDENRL